MTFRQALRPMLAATFNRPMKEPSVSATETGFLLIGISIGMAVGAVFWWAYYHK